MIRVENITKTIDTKKILDNISFVVTDQLIAILGATGVGKTVLLKIIAGLIKPDSGRVLIDKDETLGFVFQHSALFDSMTVEENIRLPLSESRHWQEELIDQKVKSIAETFHFDTPFLKKYCSQLSGGERKLVAIARAIINNPTYLLYDEPTIGLDPITHNKICDVIKDLNKPGILVTHNSDTIKKIEITTIYQLQSGKLSLL